MGILAGEKKTTSKLLDYTRCFEKLYRVDNHIFCAVAGITSDANILINTLRLGAQQYTYAYGEPIPVEQMIVQICDKKQGYTQFGGLRPFGVSFLFAGYDEHHGFQLYHTDPSGNYSGWKATVIGANNQAGKSLLKTEYKKAPSVQEALMLALRVLNKTMDGTAASAEKMELFKMTLDDKRKCQHHILTATEAKDIID